MWTTIFIACALAMDSFVVALCGGASLKETRGSQAILVGLYFGGFQGLMSVVGWGAGKSLHRYIGAFDHWIAFALLFIVGGKMLYEAFSSHEECSFKMHHRMLLLLALATSIDACGVGLSFALLQKPIVESSIIIGIVAFIFSFVGLYAGKVLEKYLERKAEIFGGLILIGIGLKILYDHIG